MRVRLRALFALALLSLCLLIAGPTSSALAYPPTTCSNLSISTEHPVAGATITVSGTNFPPNKTIKIVLRTKTYLLATVTTDARGRFSVRVKIPAGVSGHHTIVAIGGANGAAHCPVDPFQGLTIQGVNSSTSPGGSPTSTGGGGPTSFTGVDVAALLAAAALLVGVGVLVNRRGRAGARH